MKYHMGQVVKEKKNDARFYKLNIENNLAECNKYNISSVPNTLIFKDGEEVSRIIGVISASNLKKIYKRTNKQ